MFPFPLRSPPLPSSPQNTGYAWAYEVAAPSSGDRKAAREERRGDLVVGQYSVVEPDGSLRVVDYFVKPETGFRASVNNDAEVMAQRVAAQYPGADVFQDPQLRSQRPQVTQDVFQMPQTSPAATSHFETPQFRSQSPQVTQDVFQRPQTSSQVPDHFKSPHFRTQRPQVTQDAFQRPQTSSQVPDHFTSPHFRDQTRDSQLKDHFQSPHSRDHILSPHLKDTVQSPLVTDHFKAPQFRDQFQRPQSRDPAQSPQFRLQSQSPRLQDSFTGPFKEFGNLFRSPQFGSHQLGQVFQLPQIGGQVAGQPFTEFQFQHPHFGQHHILTPQLQNQPLIFPYPHPFPIPLPHLRQDVSAQSLDRLQSSPFRMQQLFDSHQATGNPFSHPTFSKHQFLNQPDQTRSEHTKEQSHGQPRSDPTQEDQFRGHGVVKDDFQGQQAQREQLKPQQARADTPQGRDQKDRFPQQVQGSADQLRSQDFSRDHAQRQQFSEGVFQNPQSRFQHEKQDSRDSLQRQQQFNDQPVSRSPTVMSSVPGSGVTLKTSLSNVDSQRHTQSPGRPLPTAAASSALTQDRNRARGFTSAHARPEARPEARPSPEQSPVTTLV